MRPSFVTIPVKIPRLTGSGRVLTLSAALLVVALLHPKVQVERSPSQRYKFPSISHSTLTVVPFFYFFYLFPKQFKSTPFLAMSRFSILS